MLHFYEELPIIDSESWPRVKDVQLFKFISEKTVKEAGIESSTTTEDRGIWSDPAEIRVFALDDVFPLIVECGWEYKSTYWKGGSMGSAHPVLCFTKSVEG